MAKNGRRSLKLPLLDVLRDVARAHPGIVLSRPGMEDMEVEELAKYIDLAVIDPRLLPNARAAITGHNFFWLVDQNGIVVVMVHDPRLKVDMPMFTGAPRPPSMGARDAGMFSSGEGPWNEILRGVGDKYSDFVRAILLSRIRNSVAFLGMTGDEAMRWALCFADATPPGRVREILRGIVPEVADPDFAGEVERLLRLWHGSAELQARQGLLESLLERARSWYLFLSAASDIEEGCGWPVVYTHSKTPGVILMDAAHYAERGLWAPAVN